MSAEDPKRTCAPLTASSHSARIWKKISGTGGDSRAQAGFHQSLSRLGGGVACREPRPTAWNAVDRVPRYRFARSIRASCCRLPQRSPGNRLRRGAECRDRVPLGRKPVRARARAGYRSSSPLGRCHRHGRRRNVRCCGQGCDCNNSHRVQQRRRSGQGGARRQSRPTRRQCDRCQHPHHGIGGETPRAAARYRSLGLPNFAPALASMRESQAGARTIGKDIAIFEARSETEIETAFAKIAQARPGALIVAADPSFNSRRDRITALAARLAIPTIYEQREFAVAGGLISYGTSLTEAYRQQGIYAGRNLKGEKPGDLPIIQLAKFELVINLKTAKALGLTIPSGVLSIADEIIE